MTNVQVNDRIRLISMGDDPDPIPAGSTGTVTRVTQGPLGQVCVDWDCGRALALVPGVDQFEVIVDKPQPQEVPLPRAVYEGILAARASGMYNMLDIPAIAGLTCQLGFDEAADWLNDRSNRSTYAQGIFRGFQPEGK